MATILKERYFPRGSFLETNLGFRASVVLRSIRERRELLVKGLKWRVGIGIG